MARLQARAREQQAFQFLRCGLQISVTRALARLSKLRKMLDHSAATANNPLCCSATLRTTETGTAAAK